MDEKKDNIESLPENENISETPLAPAQGEAPEPEQTEQQETPNTANEISQLREASDAAQEKQIIMKNFEGKTISDKEFSPNETARMYVPRTQKLEAKKIAQTLNLGDTGDIKVVVKKAAGNYDQKKEAVKVTNYKRHQYIPPSPEELEERKKAEEEKHKKELEEKRKKHKKGKDDKEKKGLAQSGLLPKLIIVGFLLLVGLGIWYYISFT